jgi:ribonuclease E
MTLEVIRMIMLAAQQPNINEVVVRVNDKVATLLNNQKRRELAALEAEGGLQIRISGSENVFPEHLELDCRDKARNQIRLPV